MKVFTGIVTSTKMAKTAKVAVTRVVAHPVYGKRIKRTKNYLVHDETGVHEGDRVQFVACKPYSKLKRWTIITPEKKVTKASKAKPVTKKTEPKKSAGRSKK